MMGNSPLQPPAPATAKHDHLVDPQVLDLLARVNQVGAMLNHTAPRDTGSLLEQLQVMAESAASLFPGAAVVIYSFREEGDFQSALRAQANGDKVILPDDTPRPDGMGARAFSRNRRILSYEEADLDIHPLKAHAGIRTIACFPLDAAGQMVGVIYVLLFEPRLFSQLELLLLENFANQIASAIYQTRQLAITRESLRRKDDELLQLRKAGLLISSRPRLEETLEAILQMAMEVTGARYGIFRLVDKTGRHLITQAIAGDRLARPLVDALPVEAKSIMSWVARQRQAVLIHDLRKEPWVELYYPLDADLEMKSELAVPLVGASGRLEGVLNLESPLVGAFSETDSHLLQALATQAVVAIQEARLLDALQEVAQLLLTQPFEQVLDHLAELSCTLLNASASVIWIRQDEELVLTNASSGCQVALIDRGDRLPLQGSLAGQAVLACLPVFSEDVCTDPRFHRVDLAEKYGWRQALVVPLIGSGQGEPIGAFSVYRSEVDFAQAAAANAVNADAANANAPNADAANAKAANAEAVTNQDVDTLSVNAPRLHTGSEWDVKVLTCLAHYAALAVQNADRQQTLNAIQERNATAEAFAAMGDIAANLLHNLNNKVGIIPVRVQGIQDKCQDALKADAYLESSLAEIERSAAQAMEFVRQNLSHLHPIQVAPVSVHSCIQQAVQQVDFPNGVQLIVESLDCLPVVMAGERSLTLVFTNLLENAVAAMSAAGLPAPGGEMRIDGKAHPDWVEVSISDNGPGIQPELQPFIFDLNVSGHAKSRPGKLGFGLWWVKTAMTRLGGTVMVESDGANGTTFRLRLPRTEPLGG